MRGKFSLDPPPFMDYRLVSPCLCTVRLDVSTSRCCPSALHQSGSSCWFMESGRPRPDLEQLHLQHLLFPCNPGRQAERREQEDKPDFLSVLFVMNPRFWGRGPVMWSKLDWTETHLSLESEPGPGLTFVQFSLAKCLCMRRRCFTLASHDITVLHNSHWIPLFQS